ncbi:hypothetical protein [uncultured Roseobacter sp.]|uniref:hypothetical protein n=1 Tax=uncultured Roseobacter sp. TaxID=114847 RepID=UPI0026148FD5|nr:hypothetical protein [uncultured Roseobacter sp.]
MQIFRYALCGVILSAVASVALSLELETLAPCYTRSYSADHLAAQPAQNVTTLTLSLRIEDGFAIARLTGTDRAGRAGFLSFMCSESAPGLYDDGCNTLEGDSQIWVQPQQHGEILVRTRNVFLSDIGQGIDYRDDIEGHYRFYLEDGPHSYEPNTGPFYTFRLNPADAEACASAE